MVLPLASVPGSSVMALVLLVGAGREVPRGADNPAVRADYEVTTARQGHRLLPLLRKVTEDEAMMIKQSTKPDAFSHLSIGQQARLSQLVYEWLITKRYGKVRAAASSTLTSR